MSFIKSLDFNLDGKTLVLPSNSVGSGPMLGVDLFLVSNSFRRIGFFKSKQIAYLVGSNIFNEESTEA